LIGLISLNFKNAPLDLREKFYLDNADKIVFHNLLKKNVGVEGLMLLSTCNRTEIYFEFENHIGKENKFIHSIVKELADFRKFKDSISPHLMMVSGSYKVSKHLFRLVSGLESMIIGEFQIVEQLKDAYDFSYKHKMLGPILKRMFQKSLETGKFIRTNTKIGKGAVSVSYAAVEKIHKDLNISNPKFLCVGLGETSQLSIRHLHQKGYPNLKITNRTNKKASEFASELGYSSVDFSSFKEELKKVDVAIFSTSSKNPLLSKNEVEKIMSERDNELLMIDLSVPRNIPDSCNKIGNVKLINVDGLKDVVNVNYKKRKAEVKKAEKFIDDFLSEFDDWTNSRQLRPSILSIKNQIKDVVVEETINNINSSSCDCNSNIVNSDEFNEKLNKIYEKFSDNLVRKIKEASNNGKDEKAIEIINQIFLDD
jgi:glutamyl-tRNA reductase|tara:strand:+ start:7368 stop:8642 length:1275 start_codon:yes stop_codon:yes gene_type:complete